MHDCQRCARQGIGRRATIDVGRLHLCDECAAWLEARQVTLVAELKTALATRPQPEPRAPKPPRVRAPRAHREPTPKPERGPRPKRVGPSRSWRKQQRHMAADLCRFCHAPGFIAHMCPAHYLRHRQMTRAQRGCTTEGPTWISDAELASLAGVVEGLMALGRESVAS